MESAELTPTGDLKPGLVDGEDPHADMSVGFFAESPTVFFGKSGRKHADAPYITFRPDGGENFLIIPCGRDFLLFDWSISCVSGECFDEYGSYSFSCRQWMDILDTAERIVSFPSFDDLFDHLIGRGLFYTGWRGERVNFFLGSLNARGAYFWYSREKYLTQLRDVQKWTQLVLTEDGAMHVFGF